MKKRNWLTIWAKRAIPALTLAGTAGVMLPSCDKEPVEKAPVYDPNRAPYEKTLWFNTNNWDSVQPKIIKYFANDPVCTHIYLTLDRDARDDNLTTNAITLVRKEMQKCVDVSPKKISGRGDWWFKRGYALPADSLWFVQHGWTVNQNQH
ncbi:MAG: hypothetical protein NC324_09130 [Bacteroides sp.]|nr:hypothetical protein [Bacteroides sp.]